MNVAKDRRIGWLLAGFTIALMWPVRNHGIVMNDDGILLQAATRLLAGQVPGVDFPVLHPPGFPALIAAAMELGGGTWVAYRVLLIALRALTTVLLYGILRRIAPALPSAIAVLGTILVPGHWHKTPVILVVVLITWFALRWWERPDHRRLVVFGAVTGAAAFLRLDIALITGGLATLVVCAFVGPPAAGSRPRRLTTVILSCLVPSALLYGWLGVGPLHFLRLPLELISGADGHRLVTPYPGLDQWTHVSDNELGFFRLLLYHWTPWAAAMIVGRSIVLRKSAPGPWEFVPRMLVVGAGVTLLHQVAWISNFGHLLQATPLILSLAVVDASSLWVSGGVRSRAIAVTLFVPWLACTGYNFLMCDDQETGSAWMLHRTMTDEVQTAIGPVLLQPPQAASVGAILQEIGGHGTNQTPLFAFPMMSLFYPLSARPNPTNLDALSHATYRASILDEATEQAIAREIIDAGTDPVLLDEPVSFLGIPRRPDQRMSEYARGLLSTLTDHYEVNHVIGTTLVLRPRESVATPLHLDQQSRQP